MAHSSAQEPPGVPNSSGPLPIRRGAPPSNRTRLWGAGDTCVHRGAGLGQLGQGVKAHTRGLRLPEEGALRDPAPCGCIGCPLCQAPRAATPFSFTTTAPATARDRHSERLGHLPEVTQLAVHGARPGPRSARSLSS